MLSRWLARGTSNLRSISTLTLISSNKSLHQIHSPNPNFNSILQPSRYFSTNRGNGDDGFTKDPSNISRGSSWNLTPDEQAADSIFSQETVGDLSGLKDVDSWGNDSEATSSDVFGDIDKEFEPKKSNGGRASRSDVNVDSWGNDSAAGRNIFGDVDKEFEPKSSSGGRGGRLNANVDSWGIDSATSSDVFGDVDKEFERKRSSGGRISRPDVNVDSWGNDSETTLSDVFGDVEPNRSSRGGGDGDWKTAEGYKEWSFGDEKNEIFDLGERIQGISGFSDTSVTGEQTIADPQLEKEKEDLSAKLKGPKRAFGDLIAASGITYDMLDSLIVLKDLEGVEGLPPLREIEEIRLAQNETKDTKGDDRERQKQEEIAKSRVRRVDDKGRAYGTGRRKCSVARVFIQPGDGKFLINDKQFDVYFPMLDHRADLLRPFSETKTLGLWDVRCTVKGGGTSGQVGAIRLGISRALQNWEPGLRQDLRAVGFLTRDPRMVERKKPGKAKARKSYQWVKR